jgi:CDP-diacylglycerol--glycerol-3-phosphate 3-phosphatidyltransferase
MINLPNLLSLTRILLVPLLVVVLLTKFDGREFVCLAVFLLAALTDFLDGFIARRRQLVTRLGKLLDPAADKILTSAAFISLVEIGLAPAWMVVVIISREFAVSTLRSVAATEREVMAAAVSAKVKTVAQIVAISLLIVQKQLGEFERLAEGFLWVAMLASIYSGVEYFVRYTPLILRGGKVGAGPSSR